MNVVVIGRGAAAMAACRTFATHGAGRPPVSLVLVGDEPEPYSKVALTGFVSGELNREQVLLPELHSNASQITGRATHIERDTRNVVVQTAEGTQRVPYDYVILCTGARPVARFGQPFWTLRDAEQVIGKIDSKSSTAIIGGGFVGLHLAQALLHLTPHVTLMEREPCLLPGRLSKVAAEFLETQMRSAGVKVLTGISVVTVNGVGKRSIVTMKVGGKESTEVFDHVFDCTGVTPDVELARAAGIDVSDSGIVVDRCQRTSDDRVLAAGDCAAVAHVTGRNRSAGLWHAAEQQGHVAAAIILGIAIYYNPCIGWNTFRIPQDGDYMTGASFGEFQPHDCGQVYERGQVDRGDYRYLAAKNGAITGYLALGDPRGMGALMVPGGGRREIPPADFWPASIDSWLYYPWAETPTKTRVLVRRSSGADR